MLDMPLPELRESNRGNRDKALPRSFRPVLRSTATRPTPYPKQRVVIRSPSAESAQAPTQALTGPSRVLTRSRSLEIESRSREASLALSDLSDLSDATSVVDGGHDAMVMDSVEDCQGRIPKPVGEAGRPNRGGYTLETVLCWSEKEYETFKVCHVDSSYHLQV
jgi:hypothetical protein